MKFNFFKVTSGDGSDSRHSFNSGTPDKSSIISKIYRLLSILVFGIRRKQNLLLKIVKHDNYRPEVKIKKIVTAVQSSNKEALAKKIKMKSNEPSPKIYKKIFLKKVKKKQREN